MAEQDYRRLGCAVEECDGGHKAHGYCLRHYRQWQRGGIKKDATECDYCGAGFRPAKAGAIYCSKRCKHAAWVKANPERHQEHRQTADRPNSCTYYAQLCAGCGKGWGAPRRWTLCPGCKVERERAAACLAARVFNETKHRAAGRVVHCNECRAAYCPLYGAKTGAIPLCAPCAAMRRRRAACGGTNVQRAKRAGVLYRHFSERKVLVRDGWRCQLCGVDTPESLRGTCASNAPEFDHCIPLARGGPHLPENGQCLCRNCNGLKADTWCERSVAAAKARGVTVGDGAQWSPQDRKVRRGTQGMARVEIAAPAGA